MRRTIWNLFALGLACTGISCAPATAPNTASVASSSMNKPSGSQGTLPTPHTTQRLPVPKHVVVVMEENHGYGEIVGNPSAPYLNSLVQQGASLTNDYAVEHPSEPNYLDIFSGSNQGITDDSCPNTLSAPNLASSLLAAGGTFVGYSESLPYPGFTGCSFYQPTGSSVGTYARKHSPWVNFQGLPGALDQPFSAFPAAYDRLPVVSFVIPNLEHDMHDGTVAAGDTWLRQYLSGYVTWAQKHDSLLIVTWDEDDVSQNNHVAAIFVGPMVHQGTYGEWSDHFRLLRTIEAMYGLQAIGNSRNRSPITDIWNKTW